MISPSERRQQILDEMTRLDRLQRGYLSKQFFTRSQDGQTIRQGPYYVLQHAFKGPKVSRRIPKEQVPTLQADLAAWRRFEQLAQEFVEVTEKMTLEAQSDIDSKKNVRRLSRDVIRKPKRS
jgi:hypothetical protein